MPDLNSVPPSPHFLATSSRSSSAQQNSQPPAPGSPSLHILPSNQSIVNPPTASPLPSPRLPLAGSFTGPSMGDNTGVGPGPGPSRHPRPLTAADLHLQLEKEQEAVVNRLSRELSILRAAQNASVVSNASSTSATASGTEHGSTSHYPPVRHHRTSSSASTRSVTANVGSVAGASMGGISSPAPIRPTAQPPIAISGISLSRQNSSASRRSRTGSPSPATSHSLSGSYTQHHINEPGSLPGYFSARVPAPARSLSGNTPATSSTPAIPTPGSTSTTTTPSAMTTTSELSPGILPATSRFEEAALRRAELEEVKRENEALRRRVRELERLVREAAEQRRRSQGQTAQADASGSRTTDTAMSSAVSVTGVGVPEEEVKVGESAASDGLGRGREPERE